MINLFVSIGGYVIMDDWFTSFPSKTACKDFFKVHGISPQIVQVDRLSAKTEHVDIHQQWRYKQSKFKFDQTSD